MKTSPELALPTLTVDGFTTNPAEILLRLYEYFLSSDYSQSNIYYTKIASLKYIISEAKDSRSLKEAIIDSLNKMYLNYFSTVIIEVTVDEDNSSMKLSIDINCLDTNGNRHVLSKLVNVVDNKIVAFTNLQEEYHATGGV